MIYGTMHQIGHDTLLQVVYEMSLGNQWRNENFESPEARFNDCMRGMHAGFL